VTHDNGINDTCTLNDELSNQYEKWGWDTFEKNFMDKDRLRDICQLQRDLMANAWSLLTNDGLMVYSTCSLSIKQNEENVAWFLHKYAKEANLEKIPCLSNIDIKSAPIKQGWQLPELQENDRASIELSIESNCVRFDPIVSGTSGFFVARFRKMAARAVEPLTNS
jgi:16S rRNA C967 or C1407 C5-methylase (RsmB/RsmF family)